MVVFYLKINTLFNWAEYSCNCKKTSLKSDPHLKLGHRISFFKFRGRVFTHNTPLVWCGKVLDNGIFNFRIQYTAVYVSNCYILSILQYMSVSIKYCQTLSNTSVYVSNCSICQYCQQNIGRNIQYFFSNCSMYMILMEWMTNINIKYIIFFRYLNILMCCVRHFSVMKTSKMLIWSSFLNRSII